MIECLCIDSDNKPKEVQLSEWISKGMKYHITHVYFHPNQGIQGCSLREVRLSSKSYPYESYALKRFAVTPEGYLKLLEMIKICSDLNDLDIKELLKESELNIITNE